MSSNLTKILICWLIPEQLPQNRGLCELCLSPLGALSHATTDRPDLIAMVFNSGEVLHHNGVVELCKILKAHPLTAKTRVAAFIERPHQKLIERLARAGADSVDFRTGMEPEQMKETISQLWQARSLTPVQKILERLCPFLDYLQSDDGKYELTVCGAYRNRMVLGGSRLHGICHTADHRHCEYYLNPKVVS